MYTECIQGTLKASPPRRAQKTPKPSTRPPTRPPPTLQNQTRALSLSLYTCLPKKRNHKEMKVLTIGHSIPYLQKLVDSIPSKLSRKCEEEQCSTPFSFSSQQRSLANLRVEPSLKKGSPK